MINLENLFVIFVFESFSVLEIMVLLLDRIGLLEFEVVVNVVLLIWWRFCFVLKVVSGILYCVWVWLFE